jgi:hypothetical protein
VLERTRIPTSVQIGVLITPGATAVTRIPNLDSKGARHRTNPETACLEAMYSGVDAEEIWPAMLETCKILPGFFLSRK